MDRKTHKALISQYLELGGNSTLIKNISSFSLANHAKLKYHIKQLLGSKEIGVEKADEEIKPEIQVAPPAKRKSAFSDLISNYPEDLHEVFKNRYNYWLESCSIKLKLNAVPIDDQDRAYELQCLLFEKLDGLDKCQEILDYYTEHKRILPTHSNKDFTNLTAMELLKKRNNLRSNISKREKTLRKIESELSETAPDYRLRLHLYNRKREQLEVYKNELKEVDVIIKAS